MMNDEWLEHDLKKHHAMISFQIPGGLQLDAPAVSI